MQISSFLLNFNSDFIRWQNGCFDGKMVATVDGTVSGGRKLSC